ncbi:MAG: hypothetical protein JOY61_18835, partial [Chloroflexi bacterium]|nr:hypothetical protein [Chloroflexota bacterium]
MSRLVETAGELYFRVAWHRARRVNKLDAAFAQDLSAAIDDVAVLMDLSFVGQARAW